MKVLAINGGKPVRTKPFPVWPVWDEAERKVLHSVLESGKWGYPFWEFVPRFEKVFAMYHDAQYGVCYSSGTAALVGALWAVGIQPGDEVIVPAYTFIATASAVIQLGAIPIFADIERNSFHLSAESVDEHFTERTTAVIAVHIGGRPADMTRLKNVCGYRNIILLEDAAQAWGSEWKNKRVGALGSAGIFSFQSSKNITAGEGGIAVTNDETISRYLRTYCNCGRIEGKPRYEHHYIGGNYRLCELQGAVLSAQFERYPRLHLIRKENAAFLNTELAKIDGIIPINEDESVTENAYHLYLIRYKKLYFKDVPKSRLIQALQAEGILAHPGYTVPLHKQPVFVERMFGSCGKANEIMPDYRKVSLPETETACDEEAIWFAQNVLLGTVNDMKDIVEAFHKIKEHCAELVDA